MPESEQDATGPILNIEAVNAFFEQSGILSLLPEESMARLNDALSALSALDLTQMALPDVSSETYHGWVVRLLQLFDDFDMHHDIVGDPMKFAICWAWWVTVNRQAKAVSRLYKDGLAGDAAPLLRSIIEYSVWCAALSWDEGSLLATIMRASDDEDKKMIKNLNEGLIEIPAEVMTLINAVPRMEGEGSPAKSFIAVCRSLGIGDIVVPVWRFFSSLSHPTATTAYLLTQPSREGMRVKKTPGLPGLGLDAFVKQALAISVQGMLWGGFAIDRLIEGGPLHAQLQVIADEAHVTDLAPQDSLYGSDPCPRDSP